MPPARPEVYDTCTTLKDLVAELERQATLDQQRIVLGAAITGLLCRQPDAPLDVTLDYERVPEWRSRHR